MAAAGCKDGSVTLADVKKTLLLKAYENNRGSSVAFIDESYLAPSFSIGTSAPTFYLMTAYVIAVEELEPMRDDLHDLVGGDYWHSTNSHRSPAGQEKIREFTSFVGDGDEALIVALQRPIDSRDSNGEVARSECWRALLPVLSGGNYCDPVSLAIFEERKFQKQRNADEMSIKTVRNDGLIPRTMQVCPTSPTYERLLWLPDVVSFALYQSYGAVRTDYAQPFADRVIEIAH